MNARPSRRRLMGLAIGSIWLVAIGGVFGIWALIAIDTAMARGTLAGAAAFIVALIAVGAVVVRATKQLPIEAPRSEELGVPGRFAWIVGLEILAFAVVNSWAAMSRRFELIPSLDLIIVGVHFFPLARLFRVPRYYLMAVLFCAIPLATLAWVPQELLVGHAPSWYVLPSLGCGAVASLMAAASLREAWNSSNGTRRAV